MSSITVCAVNGIVTVGPGCCIQNTSMYMNFSFYFSFGLEIGEGVTHNSLYQAAYILYIPAFG